MFLKRLLRTGNHRLMGLAHRRRTSIHDMRDTANERIENHFAEKRKNETELARITNSDAPKRSPRPNFELRETQEMPRLH